MTAKVYFNSQYQQYHARIYVGIRNGKPTYFHVGRFRTKEIAEAKAKDMLERML